MTNLGSPLKKLPGVSREAHAKEKLDGRVSELKPLEMGVQIPCGVYPEGPPEGVVRGAEEVFGRGVPGKLAEQKESRIEEGHLLPDHVHMLISIPPKYAVAQVIGFIKGKSAIHLARVYGARKQNFVGQSFWARGYFVSTVGRDEALVREYIRTQEEEDKRLDQWNMWR